MTTIMFDEEKLMKKLRWKIVPYIFLLFVIAMLDRMNIGFAALEMNKALGINASAFGMIAGLFFIAYFFFEVPSNILMHKFGARVWITRILISWGAVTVITGFVNSMLHLAIMRCLLGIAEAGFYPCIILYLTYWFPGRHLASTVSMFMCAIVAANIITGPISTWIVDNANWFNIAGWRWLFILEGIPAILCGFITPFVMTDRPENAKFLTEEEKSWLISTIKRDNEQKMVSLRISKWEVFKQLRVWHLAWCFFCYNTAQYGLSLWMPQIIKSLSKVLTNTQVGLISTLPFICAGIAMLLNAYHSDKTQERRYHVGLPIMLAFFGFIALTLTNNLWWSVILICICYASIFSFVASFWTLPNAFLSGATAAVGLAIINSVGNLGGFVGPYVVGLIRDFTQSTTASMYFLACIALLASISILAIPKRNTVIISSEQILDGKTIKNL